MTANLNVPLNAELRVGDLQETVIVAGATPVVDVQQAGSRQVLSRTFLDLIPNNRTAPNIPTGGKLRPLPQA